MNMLAKCNSEILVGETVQATIRLTPFAKPSIRMFQAGTTVTEIIDAAGLGGRHCSVRADGFDVPPERRIDTMPRETVEIVAVPGSGAAKVIRSIARVLVAVVAVVAQVVLTPIIGPVFAALVAGALTLAGSLAINALFPTAQPQLAFSPIGSVGGISSAGAISAGSASRSSSSGIEGSPTFSIGGSRNDFAPYGPVPLLLGEHRISPVYAAQIATEQSGDEQFLRAIFCWGHGDMTISDLRLGETLIGSFEGVGLDTQTNWTGDIAPPLYPIQTFQEDLNVSMLPNVGNFRTTADDTDEIQVDIGIPNGLYKFQKSDGNRVAHSVSFFVDYRVTGTETWSTMVSGTINGSGQTAIRKTYRAVVARNKYDVHVRRTSAAYSGVDVVSEGMVWTAIRSFRNETPISVDYGIAITALRIRATAQLSGVVETFNGIGISKVKSWNGSAWVDNTESSNPADLWRHVLQCSANRRPKTDAEIDLDTIADWADYCTAEGFTFNQYRDFKSGAWGVLRDIAAAGRAVSIFPDGKWSVVWDDPNSPVIQHFTPQNSSGFSGSRQFVKLPHGFRVRFVNATKGWQQDERIVYDDGYSAANATEFESLEFPGVTDPDLIYRHARFHLAQLRLRREMYELETDSEHLVCQRGDRVRVTHDVPQWGLVSGRVAAVDGEIVDLSGSVPMLPGGVYSIRFRLADGASSKRAVVTEAGTVSRITMAADAGATAPEVGDVYQFGELDSESVVLRVFSRRSGPDFSARLTLVDDAPAIYSADTGAIPAFDSQITDPIDFHDLPPTKVLAVEAFELVSGGIRSVANLSWLAPLGPVTGYLVQYRLDSEAEWSAPIETGSASTVATVTDLISGSYRFRVKAVFGSLMSGWSAEATLDTSGSQTVPADVENFLAEISGSNLILSWDNVNNILVRGYEIRFSGATSGASWASAATVRPDVRTNSAVLPYAKGTYLIKGVTHNNVASAAATLVIVNVEPLSAINVVETATDDPGFGGTHDRTYFNEGTGAVILDNAQSFFTGGQFFTGSKFFSGTPGREPLGYYTLADDIDLGAVMTARLSSDITVGGFKLNAKFFTGGQFFTGSQFFSADPDQWDLTTEVRTTDDDPGASPTWSAWSQFLVGDYTARGFQFRLKLESFSPLVTPAVTAATFTVDMPDRIIADGDVASTTSGKTVPFSPPFVAIKAVNITPQNLSTGDYFTITYDRTAFTVNIFNTGGTKIDVPFDYQAIGYGGTT